MDKSKLEKKESKKITETNVDVRKYDYSKDKRRWVKRKNGTKLKLRKYVSELASIISKETGNKLFIERKFIIKAYNAGGINGIMLWINKHLQTKNEKNENKA